MASDPCLNLVIEFPKGIGNPGDGSALYLSNLALSDTHIFSGGQFDTKDVYEGGAEIMAPDGGIPFLNKQKLSGL